MDQSPQRLIIGNKSSKPEYFSGFFKGVRMKKYLKTAGNGLLPIFLVLGLTGYFIAIVLRFPLIGMEVFEKNNQWIVEKIYENGWAASQPIGEGDIIKFVDEKNPENHSTVKRFNRVEMAKSISILTENSKTKTFSISYSHLDTQYVIYLLLPFLFAVTTILLSIFLYQRKKDDHSAILLIYFLLSIGVCYLSASVSARSDIIGRISNTITLPGSIILFAHFIKRYLIRFNLVFIKTRTLVILYVLNSILILLMVINLKCKLNFQIKMIQLIFFLLLTCYLLFHLTRLYLKNKNSEGNNVLIILWISLFAAFSPFVCLYVIPNILFKKELVSAESTAIFLIIIPVVFVYLQLTERIFDIDFLLSRLRYYSLLSFPFAVFTVLLLSFILNIEPFSASFIIILLFVFICTTIFLYVKEFLDYKIRHHLFSQKSNFETSLYTFFQKAKYETKVNSLITNLVNEIRDVLMVKDVLYIEMVKKNEGNNWLLKNRINYPLTFVGGLENIKWDNQRIGSLIEVLNGFGIVIGEDLNNKNIIYFGMKRSNTNLNIPERIWLETLAYFSSILLENFQLIEGLFEKIEDYKGREEMENEVYPYWFSRLMFSLSEKERANLSIDLHDSVLQDQLQILREIEKVKSKITDKSIKDDLIDLKERMLDNIHLIRETCNELRPPFLGELGVIQSIQNLIEQTKLRSNFILKSELDQSIQRLDNEYELTLYRVVQELLNNAMKHSLATEVMLSLRKTKQVLYLTYHDNGKGMDMSKLNDSFQTMGIFGMKERVKSIGGILKINSAPGKGTHVFIEIHIGGIEDD